MARNALTLLLVASLALNAFACSDDETNDVTSSSNASGTGGHDMGGMGPGGADAGGEGGSGGTSSGEAPIAPSNLTVEPLGAGLHVTWTDESDDEDDFVVERKADGGAFAEVITLPFDSTSHHDEGDLASGVMYTYRVGAENSVGISYSDEVEAMAP
jgi:hypothetical protein